ncbi:MAG TPA: hypothetical protein VMZ26_18205 [Pyrinomonadaceae bacterium]|nr:hypothetical protein [Pyrinomonadaceae bacterium]
MDFELAATDNPHSRSDMAWALTVYSMVPYLGILFVPFALILSGFHYVRARRRSSNDRGRFLLCAALSSFILALQLFLWWLLYFIPKMSI